MKNSEIRIFAINQIINILRYGPLLDEDFNTLKSCERIYKILSNFCGQMGFILNEVNEEEKND